MGVDQQSQVNWAPLVGSTIRVKARVYANLLDKEGKLVEAEGKLWGYDPIGNGGDFGDHVLRGPHIMLMVDGVERRFLASGVEFLDILEVADEP